MLNVALIQPILSPNRTPVFERLAQQEGINLKLFVLHAALPERPGWTIGSKHNFDIEAVKTIVLKMKYRNVQTEFSEPYRLPIGLFSGLVQFKPQIIIVSNATEALFCLPFKFLFKTKIGIIAGDTLEIMAKGSARMRVLKKFVYNCIDTFCVYGEETKRYLTTIGIPENRIFKTYWGVDNDYYMNHNLRKPAQTVRAQLGKEKCVFLTVGQLVERKGICQLIDVWNSLSEQIQSKAILVVIGEGQKRSEIEDHARANQFHNILLTGHLNPSKIVLYYRAADVFIFPTLEDIWGLVVNEAMASGLPILCSKFAGCARELVKDGINGYIIDPLDPLSISGAIEKIVEDEIDVQRMGKASRNLIKNYTFGKMVEVIKKSIFDAIKT